MFPFWELVALVEFDPADGDGGRPLQHGGLVAGCFGAVGQGAAVVVHAVADDGPAVVEAALDTVDFVASAGAVLALPYFAGCGMGDESLGVAVAEGPDGVAGDGLAGVGIVAGDASVVVDAMDFAVGACGVLGLVLCASVADAEVEVAVLKDEAGAKMDSGGAVLGKGGLKEDLVVDPAVVPDAAADDLGHALGLAVAFFSAGGIAEVDPPVPGVAGVWCGFKETALPVLPDVSRQVLDFRAFVLPGEEKEASGSLGEEAASVGEKGECPGVVEPVVFVEKGFKGEAVAAALVYFPIGRRWQSLGAPGLVTFFGDVDLEGAGLFEVEGIAKSGHAHFGVSVDNIVGEGAPGADVFPVALDQ